MHRVTATTVNSLESCKHRTYIWCRVTVDDGTQNINRDWLPPRDIVQE